MIGTSHRLSCLERANSATRWCRYKVVLEGFVGAIDQRKTFHGGVGSDVPGCGPGRFGHVSWLKPSSMYEAQLDSYYSSPGEAIIVLI